MLVLLFLKQIEKIPIDEIKRELKATGLSEEAIEELLQVLSIKSLTKLEGWFFHNFMICYSILFSLAKKKGRYSPFLSRKKR